MRVQIANRHCEVPQGVRDRAEELVAKLTKFDPRLSSAEVVFEEEGRLKKVEAILHLDRDEPAVARGEGEDFRSALDQALDRLSKILRRRRDQVTDHKGPKLSDLVGDAE